MPCERDREEERAIGRITRGPPSERVVAEADPAVEPDPRPARARQEGELEPEACLQSGARPERLPLRLREEASQLEPERVEREIEARVSKLAPGEPAPKEQRPDLEPPREHA